MLMSMNPRRRGHWSGPTGGMSQGGLVRRMMRSYDAAEAESRARYNRIDRGYQDLRSQAAGQSADINRRYQDRLNTGLQMLQGYGDVAREDIGRVYQQRAAQQAQALANRGLGNTTVYGNMQRGMAAGESQDAGRLAESLRGQKMGLYSSLSGQQLAAMQQQQNVGNQLGLSHLGWQAGVGSSAPSLMDIAGYKSAVDAAKIQALAFLPAYTWAQGRPSGTNPSGGYLKSTQEDRYRQAMNYLR